MLSGCFTERTARTVDGSKIAARTLTITWQEGDRGLFARAAALGDHEEVGGVGAIRPDIVYPGLCEKADI